jgi:hypothetical protein
MCMTSRGKRDVWPSLVEKAVRAEVGPKYTTRLISHTVSQTYGGIQFPWLVRQHPSFVGCDL